MAKARQVWPPYTTSKGTASPLSTKSRLLHRGCKSSMGPNGTAKIKPQEIPDNRRMAEPTPLPRPLILGSTSRYRRELLDRLRVPFQVVSPGVDETPLPQETPADLAQRLALAKAKAV